MKKAFRFSINYLPKYSVKFSPERCVYCVKLSYILYYLSELNNVFVFSWRVIFSTRIYQTGGVPLCNRRFAPQSHILMTCCRPKPMKKKQDDDQTVLMPPVSPWRTWPTRVKCVHIIYTIHNIPNRRSTQYCNDVIVFGPDVSVQYFKWCALCVFASSDPSRFDFMSRRKRDNTRKYPRFPEILLTCRYNMNDVRRSRVSREVVKIK